MTALVPETPTASLPPHDRPVGLTCPMQVESALDALEARIISIAKFLTGPIAVCGDDPYGSEPPD
jgi:hypothetical protein